MRSLPFDDQRHQRAHHFLVEEAATLDEPDFQRWLAMLTDDIRYRVPVSVTTTRSTDPDRHATMDHLDEDRYSLEKRVARLGTEYAWTEDPRSRTRHLVANVRTFEGATPDELHVESALLLFRSRGDTRPAELVCCQRRDQLRLVDGGLRLADRLVQIDEAVLRTQNLAIFL